MSYKENYYELIGEFDLYTGNFEREMTYWVFGVEWDYMPGGWDRIPRPHGQAFEDAGLGLKMEGIVLGFPHDEYELVFQEIGQDNGNFSIHWRLMEEPNDGQWKLIKDAIESYREQRKPYHTEDPQSPKLLNLTLSKVETVRTSLR